MPPRRVSRTSLTDVGAGDWAKIAFGGTLSWAATAGARDHLIERRSASLLDAAMKGGWVMLVKTVGSNG